MPCNSNKEDLEDAKLVSELFEVPLLEIDLSYTYNILTNKIEEQIDENLETESLINIKPRLRMTTLYALAMQKGYLVVGTGNLCEITVGYTTKWGDNASDLNPLGEFTVDEVLEIGKILGIPEKILNKAPSDGLGTETDEQKMGITYEQISEYIKTGRTEEKAMKKIEEMNKKSKHKREGVAIYHRIKK